MARPHARCRPRAHPSPTNAALNTDAPDEKPDQAAAPTTKKDLVPYWAVDGGLPLYLLDPRVGAEDWDRFRWLARATGAGKEDRLTEALDLVRGEPLGTHYGLGIAQADITQRRCAIGDAAHRLARLRLEALDLPRATAAARAGLRGSPWDHRLYGDLMEAAEAAGNPAGVNAVWNELVRGLEDDGDQVHPDVQAISRRCRNRQNRAT